MTKSRKPGMFRLPIGLLAFAAMLNACASVVPKLPHQGDVTSEFDLITGISEESLHEYIGKQVIVTGYWSWRGKEGGFVYGGKDSPCSIYVLATNDAMLAKQTQMENSVPENALAQIAGRLHYFSEPPAVSNGMQSPPSYLFFEIGQANVTLLKH